MASDGLYIAFAENQHQIERSRRVEKGIGM
jgi:hypothetical protein